MIIDFTLGSADIARSIRFYDPVLATLGIGRAPDPDPGWVGWGDKPALWLVPPFNQKPASAGNGTMISFAAKSEAEVQDFHKSALESGGTSEGEPGTRPYYSPNFYVAYVKDPDGNKLAAVFHKW